MNGFVLRLAISALGLWVASQLVPGSIIVFHANGKGKQTRQVIERLTIEVLPHKGLKPMTVSELLNCKPPTP